MFLCICVVLSYILFTGIYKWPDGRSYDGEWRDGKQHGEGIFIDRNGKKRTAECKNGEKIKWMD
jgi:hypothetical protein